MPAGRLINVLNEAFLVKIVLQVIDSKLRAAPARFKSPESLILQRCPSEIQFIATVASESACCFPHHQVISPQMLQTFIRSAILENRSLSPVKENRGSDRLIA